MRDWFGFCHPRAWPWGRFFSGYPYGYGYPWAGPKEEEIRMLEDQERWLSSELDVVRKRLSELKGQ